MWVPLRRAIDSRERVPQLDHSHGLEDVLSSPQSVIRALGRRKTIRGRGLQSRALHTLQRGHPRMPQTLHRSRRPWSVRVEGLSPLQHCEDAFDERVGPGHCPFVAPRRRATRRAFFATVPRFTRARWVQDASTSSVRINSLLSFLSRPW
jgi:hypothetical protein